MHVKKPGEGCKLMSWVEGALRWCMCIYLSGDSPAGATLQGVWLEADCSSHGTACLHVQVCSCTAHFLSTHLALSAPCALAAASAAQASSSSAPTAWIPLEAPVPLRSTHAEAYRALCPGDELHILRACTVDGVSS